MNTDMLNIAEFALKTAQSSGADECRVGIDNERMVEINYRDKKPEVIKEASKKNLLIEIYTGQKYSKQVTSDLRKDSLTNFITNAIASTKLLAEDPYRSLPDSKYFKDMPKRDLKIFDPEYQNLLPQDRHEIAQTIEDACLSSGGDKLISASAFVEDTRAESLLLSSNGFLGYEKGTYYVIGAVMTAQDEGDRRPRNYYYIVTTQQDHAPLWDSIGQEAARRTLELLGSKKLKTEILPIIIENRVVPRILGGLLQAMDGRRIQQKQSFLADKKGQKIASDHLTLVDDPFIPGGLGSRLFDRDGLAAEKRTMVDSGTLKNFYIDWYYSRKLGWEPTTGNSSNLVIPPGKRSVKQIMNDLGRGIFITGFIGGNSNSTTGDTSVGITGKMFENGELTQAVAEMNIAGNHLDFWTKLAETANDPWIYSSYRTPSLVFIDVLVSGL